MYYPPKILELILKIKLNNFRRGVLNEMFFFYRQRTNFRLNLLNEMEVIKRSRYTKYFDVEEILIEMLFS